MTRTEPRPRPARHGTCSSEASKIRGPLDAFLRFPFAAGAAHEVRTRPERSGRHIERGDPMSLWFARARAASVLALALGLALGLATTASAQGLQVSTLSGTVSSADGAVLPGATVTLTSPALQGE